MNVLVAGGSGYLGAAVAEALVARGARVLSLSRGGDAPVGEPLAGDVSLPALGLAPETAERLRAELTHVVGCFGSVDWALGARGAVEVHRDGTRALADFAAGCARLERLVHVSSVLVFGRARGRLGNHELDVGQRFRSWYEYGKFAAESELRRRDDVPWRVVRLGPVLGTRSPVSLAPGGGLPAALPTLLRGYPVHVAGHGRFPCYAGEVGAAAEVVAAAALQRDGGSTWTWFDPALPSFADVLSGLCAAWGVVPRVVESPLLGALAGAASERLGIPPALRAYAEPWVDLDPAVLDELPLRPPICEPGYVEATGAALRERGALPAGAR